MFKETKVNIPQLQHERDEEKYKMADEQKLIKLGLTPEDIEKLENPDKGGTSSMVYFIERGGKKMAIKKGVGTDPYEGSAREYIILRLLARRGGKKVAPSPRYYNENKDILITELIEGETIENLTDKDLEDIASALATVHQPEFNNFGLPFQKRKNGSQYDRLTEQIDFLDNWFAEMSPIIRGRGEEFASKLEKIKELFFQRAKEAKNFFTENSFSLIHYDLNPSNIMKDSEGQVIFLDWRQASIGDRATDVAKFFYKNYLNSGQQKTFLNAYSKIIHDPHLEERVRIYDPLIRIGSILWRLRFLNIDSKKNPELLKNVDAELIENKIKDDLQYLLTLIEKQ